MIRISKNYKLGNRITDLLEIKRIALEGKAIAFKRNKWASYYMKPAAFIVNWSINECSKYTFFKVQKIKEE